MLALFGALALLLSALGIYGVLSYLVSAAYAGDRHPARARRDAWRRAAAHCRPRDGAGRIGIGVGLAAAWGLTRLLRTLLFGVSPHDPATFAAIASLLAAVAFVASYLPGRRATRVDPLETLRRE